MWRDGVSSSQCVTWRCSDQWQSDTCLYIDQWLPACQYPSRQPQSCPVRWKYLWFQKLTWNKFSKKIVTIFTISGSTVVTCVFKYTKTIQLYIWEKLIVVACEYCRSLILYSTVPTLYSTVPTLYSTVPILYSTVPILYSTVPIL